MSNNKDQDQQQPKKENPLKQVAVLSGIGIQMGVIIYLFVLLGKWLDTNYNNGEKLFIIICTLLGVAASLYVVIKQLNRIKY
ncbi:AtpZ/AtpI family protein [Flavobacteriaceae sp. LMIT009]